MNRERRSPIVRGLLKAWRRRSRSHHRRARGHGEGHNFGVPLNITAALTVKQIMEASITSD